jgi:hypothetical protein
MHSSTVEKNTVLPSGRKMHDTENAHREATILPVLKSCNISLNLIDFSYKLLKN